MTSATASTLPVVPFDPDDDDTNADGESGGTAAADVDNANVGSGPEVPGGAVGSTSGTPAPRRRRRTQAQIAADNAAGAGLADAGGVVAPGNSGAGVPSEPGRRSYTRRTTSDRMQAASHADPTAEELQALGMLVVLARKQGLPPEEFVAQLRLAITAWDSTR